MQITKYSHQASAFPDSLRALEGKTPEQIYVLGGLPSPEQVLVAIVGTRKVTRYGEQVTYQIASELAKAGIVIVSGLAMGADSIAHRAALDAGGKTIAVLGTPLDRIYPAAHRSLAKEILATGGALISEYEVGTVTQPWFFSERDRIIAALCQATIVTESAAKGGSLITAGHANDLSRIVMAVPGNITSEKSAGTNELIQNKDAMLVRSSTDVIQALGFLGEQTAPVAAHSPEEAALAKLIKSGLSSNDQLIEASGMTPAQFANIISLMEITGKVRNLGAGNWVVR